MAGEVLSSGRHKKYTGDNSLQRNHAVVLTAQSILERNCLFRGLAATTIAQIAVLAIRRPYKERAIVFAQGDPGDALYGVITGRIRISAGVPGWQGDVSQHLEAGRYVR
jgi:CRP/FNR family transcriptional regulator, cyclic AMP receptor protein